MIRFQLALLSLVLNLFLVASAFGQSKPVLDDSFAHVKHGELYLTGLQGPQHSLGSHTNWARGQDQRVVSKEIVFQVLLSYHGIAGNSALSKEDLNRAFSYIKQGELILTGRTGPQHSLASHENWAKGQQRQAVIAAVDQELVTIRDALFPKL